MRNELSLQLLVRSVRLVIDNESENGWRWQAILSIATRIGSLANARNDLVKQAEIGSAKWTGILAEMAYKLKALERDNLGLSRTNEILC